MLLRDVRILNFDDSLLRQKRLLERYRPHVIDLTGMGPACRLWADQRTVHTIRQALKPEDRGCITLLGSGDFHHMTQLLVSQFTEPITLIVFDFHPDWDLLPPRLGCGSWVSRTLEQSTVAKALLIGVSSGDISFPAIQTGNLQALRNNRLEIYPYYHRPTRVFFRHVPENSSITTRRNGIVSEIMWSELDGRDLKKFMTQTLHRCGTQKAYVSIDKDCLRSEHALTNWEEGRLRLEELLHMLQAVKEQMDIVGLDITGEYSKPLLSGHFKRICSRVDHPAGYTAREKFAENIDCINEETNLQLLELLLG